MHQPLGGAQGQASDIEIAAREILRLKALLNGVIMQHTNMDASMIEKYTDRDSYLTAEKAKELGIIDEVTPLSAIKMKQLNVVPALPVAQL